jgi:hypothetical protein
MINAKKIKLLAATLILFISTIGSVNVMYSQTFNPFGPMQHASAESILPQSVGQKGFNEFWNYHVYLDQDIRVHITFSAVDFGSLKSPVSGLRMSIQNFDGKTWQVSREYPIDLLTVHKDQYKVMMHPERELYFEGKLPEKHRVVVFLIKDDVEYRVELDFTQIEPSLIWGDGKYGIKDTGINIITHIPYSRVRGFIEINGKRVNVSGTAYMDHSWQYESSIKLVHSAYKFVSHKDRDNWEIIYMVLPQARGEYPTIGHRISSHEGSIRHHGINRIESHEDGKIDGKGVFKSLELNLGSETVVLRRTVDREVHTTFGELSWIARRGIRTLLGGEIIDYRGKGELRVNGTRHQGEYSFLVID